MSKPFWTNLCGSTGKFAMGGLGGWDVEEEEFLLLWEVSQSPSRGTLARESILSD
jgi:hypothetical protein